MGKATMVDESEGSTEILQEELPEGESEGGEIFEAIKLLSSLEKEEQLYYMSIAGMVWSDLNGTKNEILIALLSSFSSSKLQDFPLKVVSGVEELLKENFERDDVLKVAYATVVVRFRRYGFVEDSTKLHSLYAKMKERNLI